MFDESAMNPALLKKYQDFEKEFDKERFVEWKTKLLEEVEVFLNSRENHRGKAHSRKLRKLK